MYSVKIYGKRFNYQAFLPEKKIQQLIAIVYFILGWDPHTHVYMYFERLIETINNILYGHKYKIIDHLQIIYFDIFSILLNSNSWYGVPRHGPTVAYTLLLICRQRLKRSFFIVLPWKKLQNTFVKYSLRPDKRRNIEDKRPRFY